jgi:hypothetical protein
MRALSIAVVALVSAIAALGGCSSSGNGAPTNPTTSATSFPPFQEGFDPGSGVDLGSGVDRGDIPPDHPACTFDAECNGGICAHSSASTSGDPNNPTITGVCATICALPTGLDLGSHAPQPCPRGLDCVQEGPSAGLCVRPCGSSLDCPSGEPCKPIDSHVPSLGSGCAFLP